MRETEPRYKIGDKVSYTFGSTDCTGTVTNTRDEIELPQLGHKLPPLVEIDYEVSIHPSRVDFLEDHE